MSKGKDRDDKKGGRVLVPVLERQERELKDIMSDLTQKGLYPGGKGWKDFVDDILELSISVVRAGSTLSLDGLRKYLVEYLNSRSMGFLPIPLTTLQRLVRENPDLVRDLVTFYSSFFRHSFANPELQGQNLSPEVLISRINQFVSFILPLVNKNNTSINVDGKCGKINFFLASVVGEELVSALYVPLMESILRDLEVEGKVSGDSVDLEVQFCVK